MRNWELCCQLLAYIFIFVISLTSGFIYRESNFSAMSTIHHEPNSRLVAMINGKKRFVPTQADFMPNPPSDTALILKRKTKTFETVRFTSKPAKGRN
jgi:hypothetical protein